MDRDKQTEPVSSIWPVIVALLLALWPAALAGAEPPAKPAVRTLEGRRLMLHTDLPSRPEIDELPAVFDQAFDQWCRYFDIDPRRHASWRAVGCLMLSPERFAAAGLLPGDLPEFKTGYSRGTQLWLYDQTDDYYRRHLLLHEGVHALMTSLAGGAGPPWYSEGMAELLATHSWQGGKLLVGYMPRSRDEALGLGRVEIVQRGYAERRGLMLDQVLAYNSRAHRQTEPYGWCWSAAALLDGHPRYRDRFRQLRRSVAAPDFNDQLRRLFADDFAQLAEEWQVLVANMDYGYDFARMAIDFRPGMPLAVSTTASVAADRGWQSSELQLEAGKSYQLTASGRYQLAARPKPWWCEPGGVTIRYYRGQPLGILLAAVRADKPTPGQWSGLTQPTVAGLKCTLSPKQSGTLYFRINEQPGSLADNAGKLSVTVAELPADTARQAAAGHRP